MGAKVLIYDIECTGTLGYAYGMWDTNIHKVIEQPILLSFSYCWYDPTKKKQKIVNRALIDTDTFKVDRKSDKLLARELWKLFDEADVTLGHNSKQFDDKMARMFFMKHGFEPCSPTKAIDTKIMARAIGRFGSNSLNNLSNFFNLGQKTQTTHADLWWDCLAGDAKAWKKMKIYNEQDVNLTIQVYELLRPWFATHPNMARLNDNPESCPKCGAEDSLQRRGFRVTNVGKHRRYQCQSCGGWCSRRLSEGKDADIKPTFTSFS